MTPGREAKTRRRGWRPRFETSQYRVPVITRRPDTIAGFGEPRIHAETATFEVRASEVANPRQGDQLALNG